MDFRFSEEEESFRQRVQEFIGKNNTPEAQADNFQGSIRGPNAREFVRKMAQEGLLGLSWPKEYGGKDMPPVYDGILNEELAYAHAPQATHGVGIVGRTLMKYGSDWLKSQFLPKILNEEIELALGYSEPEAGSDLASLKLRAVRDGDMYVLNGQKLFCSAADISEWVWLMVRTDPDVPKHKGISLFLVDLKTSGIKVNVLRTICGDSTTEVFFDNARIPRKYLVGEENQGWRYAMEALAYERHVLFPANTAKRMFDILVGWVKETTLDGRVLAEDPIVRHKIARLAMETEALQMLGLRVLNAVEKGLVGDVEAAMHKLYGSHLEQRIADTALDIMGPYGQLKEGSKYVYANGYFGRRYLMGVLRTVGGGSSEVQKNIIARRHLGLPT